MKTKVKKTTAIVLIISLALCLVSMIGTSLMQSNFGQSQVTTTTASLKEIGKMIRANNSAYGKNIEVTFTENANAKISFMTIIPKNASTNNPVPAVVCSHGGSNTKEMQMINYTELARRGFVVVSIDMAGHGYSDQAIDAMTNNSLGMLAAVEYAMSLGCVDETRVGVTGHSTGNTACFGSISDLNVEGSSQRIAAFVEGAGTNVAPSMTSEYADGMIWTIAVCQYDEFDTVYFDSGHILTSNIAKSFLQKVYPEYDETAVPEGQWYTPDGPIAAPTPGDALAADTAVRMVNPPLTHPMFHFSLTGTQIVLDGFYAAFGVPSGGKYIATSNQTWPVMVVFELLGLIGFFMLLFPLVDLMLETRVFSSIRRSVPEQSNMPALSNPKEWVVLVITLVALIISSFFTYMRYYVIVK